MSIFPDTIRTAPPPEYTASGGYRPGAAGSSMERLSSLPAVAGLSYFLSISENQGQIHPTICPHDRKSRYSELYGVVTVNLQESENLPFGSQFVDVNNHEQICEWLIENEIAEPIPIFARSGFCIYPAFSFNITEEILNKIK